MMIAIPVFALMVIAGWFLMPYAVTILLPNYSEGIYAAQWMLLVGFIEIFNVLANVYNVVRKQRDRLVSYLSGMCAWGIAVFLLLQLNDFTLDAFPKAMLIGFIVMLIINLYHINYYKRIRLGEVPV
jgi:hypothetical protein